jgi:hypothetical protein
VARVRPAGNSCLGSPHTKKQKKERSKKQKKEKAKKGTGKAKKKEES